MSTIKTLTIYTRIQDTRQSDFTTLRYDRLGTGRVLSSLSYSGGELSFGGGIIVLMDDGSCREVMLSTDMDGTRVGVINEGLRSLTMICRQIGVDLAGLLASIKPRNGVKFSRQSLPQTTDKVVLPMSMGLAVGQPAR